MPRFYAILSSIMLLLAGCAVTGDRAEVSGVGPDDLLKLRAGPGLGYEIILGLPEGTQVIRHDCVTEVGQRWCRVTPVKSPEVSGFVANTYLLDR
ncbi:SH3 domain-containing protein [Salipiger sp. IMCC34102]|uniref:SH3 domain-containing protein n=1 Tax=Salipiger sp. IMCC34102 TaxID=2510647 RepID=UPI00101E021C|nr:SH3 domain-containing protein [Salipiger sp. IMCC34102]RYH00774.1 SH3 domain-containing protein [Salipiger sp. IMCC34102]